ncbi:imidazole glycerol phosphate synthase subunit HisF [bacterium]|nr:imidazole glycerol phosphate synthase subunit HisF [bacterium]
MLTVRIIPCLDVEDGQVVKGIRFKDIRRAGDPAELAHFYNQQKADEIIFLDIGATYRSRKIMIDVVEKVSQSVFVPLTVGGGIRSVQDMRDLLNAGADKVAVCSAALEHPQILKEGKEMFGSQCVVLSVDAQRVNHSWHAFVKGGREDTGKDVLEWAQEGEALGAGEILLNSIDMDGTRGGYDLELTRKVSGQASIPVIASGGAGNLFQIWEAVEKGKADAVLMASLLHYKEFTIYQIKQYLKEKGVPVR